MGRIVIAQLLAAAACFTVSSWAVAVMVLILAYIVERRRLMCMTYPVPRIPIPETDAMTLDRLEQELNVKPADSWRNTSWARDVPGADALVAGAKETENQIVPRPELVEDYALCHYLGKPITQVIETAGGDLLLVNEAGLAVREDFLATRQGIFRSDSAKPSPRPKKALESCDYCRRPVTRCGCGASS